MTENPHLPAFVAAKFAAAALEAPRPSVCHRCGLDATTQWQRFGTDAEREQHWAAIEQNIRSIPDLFGSQNGEYAADRNQPVVKAVFGCDEHLVADATILHAADCGGHGTCECGGSDG